MSIGIIGAGQIGQAFTALLARHGIPAVIANSRGPETLRDIATGPIRAGTREEAAAQDMVLVAVNWTRLPAALAGLDLAGRILIDANNPIEAPLFRPAELNGRASTEVFSELVPGARVVKAFNHLAPPVLTAEPPAGGRRVLFVSGDDAAARAEVAALIERLGAFPMDLGPLGSGARLMQFPGGPLPGQNLVRYG
jgi:predicted dinucleotide-binding enzyme